MKIKLKAKVLIVLAIFALGLGWVALADTNNTYAENTPKTSLFVSPMDQKIILTPGETYVGTITISNASTSTKNLDYGSEVGSYINKRGGNLKDDYGSFSVDDATNYNMMKDWISIDKTNGSITPNSSDVITYTIRVPKNAPAGAQYASILVYEIPEEDSDNSGSKTNAGVTNLFQLASIIYANVAGETVEKGLIKENAMPTMLTTNKLEATSMVRNEGNIYTDASYTLQVWPLFSDEEICTNEESAESSIVLPNTERYHVQTCDLPSVGIFKAKQVVKIFEEESVLEKTIFVCPIWLMVLVLIIVVAIIVGIIIYIKKHRSAKETD